MHKILQNHLFCAFVANLKIDALYRESFCYKNLAIRKVFAFCDSACITCIYVSIRPSRPGSEDAAFTSKKSERTNKGENGGLHQFGPNRIKNSKTCALLIFDYKVQNTLANE